MSPHHVGISKVFSGHQPHGDSPVVMTLPEEKDDASPNLQVSCTYYIDSLLQALWVFKIHFRSLHANVFTCCSFSLVILRTRKTSSGQHIFSKVVKIAVVLFRMFS
jgi:hypothetical protein